MAKDSDKQTPDHGPRKGSGGGKNGGGDGGGNNGGDGGSGGDANFNWRGFLLLAFAVGLVSLAFWQRGGGAGTAKEITYRDFKNLVAENAIYVNEEKGQVLRIVEKVATGEEFISGYFLPTANAQAGGSGANATAGDSSKSNSTSGSDSPSGSGTATAPAGEDAVMAFQAPVILSFVQDELNALLASKNLEIADFPNKRNTFGALMITFLPLFLIIFLLFFLFRHQMKMAGRGAMNFGKSKAKMMALDTNKLTFKDVAGVDEAKEEVWEIVEFLRDPKKFQRLGGRIPKGVLMVGPPGTGKTLLARAIAGEADVPFFSISGSDFVEMFVGVGASRVRDMFEQGKKNAPCLIFIDEIDAVGRHRGHGMGGGHDEREQTLNALLVEMDGFDTQEGVIIIAATNRPDVLDPALLRPGRFDREINVGLPDVKGREEILRVHIKKVKVAGDVDLGVVARGTPGYSGAELANVINEAALLAARKGLKAITLAELEEARDKVRWGKERRSLALTEDDKEKTAYHEAGHAILLCLLENTDPLHKVTIIPRGPSLGSTMWLPEGDKFTSHKSELLDQLAVTMGGRVAEEVVFGDVATGAAGDIKQATGIARKMVCEWGMSEALGMVGYGDNHEHVFVARDMGSSRGYSEATAQKIDSEVKRLIDDAYARATELILANREKLNAIAKALLEFETLDGSHINEIMEHGELRNPPSSPLPPDLPAEPEKKEAPPKAKPSDEGDLPGDLAPAGA